MPRSSATDRHTPVGVRRRRLASGGALLSLGLLLGACGGGETATTTEGAAPAADVASSEAEASSNPDVGPLQQILGFGGDPADQMADQLEQQRKAEDSIAICMREQGFEYTPFVPDIDQGAFSADGDYGSREWVTENGFGISTNFGEEMAIIGGPGSDDPNQEYVQALPDAERDAYYTALYGAQPEPTDGEETQTIFEPAGCQGDAFEDQFGDFAIFEELEDDFELMEERAAADPRMIELDKAWVECMRNAGYEFAKQQDAFESVMKQMNEVGGGMVMYGIGDEDIEEPAFDDPTEGMTQEEIEALTPEEMQELFTPKIDEAALAEVQAYERKVALASFDCDGDNGDTRRDIQFEYEQKMIDENKALFDQVGS